MKYYLIIVCTLIVQSRTLAQDTYTVKAGAPLRQTFTFADIYQYPSFSGGRVLFKTGRSGGSKMNYNLFTGEMEFLEGKDTMSLGDKESIKAISIGSDAFFYQATDGYLQRVAETPYGKLAVKRVIRLVDRQREAGYGKTSTGNVSSVGNSGSTMGGLLIPGRTLGFVSTEDLIYRKLTNYYIGNAKGFFMVAEKKNVLKLYPEKKTSINAYLKENKVDFDSEESLKAFLVAITEMK